MRAAGSAQRRRCTGCGRKGAAAPPRRRKGRGGPSERSRPQREARRGGAGAGGVEGTAERRGVARAMRVAERRARQLAARSLAQHARAVPPPLPGGRRAGAVRGQQELPRPHRGPLPLHRRALQGARPPGPPHQSGLQRRRLGGNFAARRAAQPHRVPVSTARGVARTWRRLPRDFPCGRR